MRINGLSCCGVAELSELSYPHGNINNSTPEAEKLWLMCIANSPAAPEEGFYYRCRYIMFTQASTPDEDSGVSAISSNQGYGFDFATFIRDNNLGEVVDSIPPGINPNSKNEVKVWMWIPDMEAVKAWLVAEVARRGYTYTPPPRADYVATYSDPDVDVVAEVPDDLVVVESDQPRRPDNLRFARAQMRALQQTLNRRMFTNNTPTSRRPR